MLLESNGLNEESRHVEGGGRFCSSVTRERAWLESTGKLSHLRHREKNNRRFWRSGDAQRKTQEEPGMLSDTRGLKK